MDKFKAALVKAVLRYGVWALIGTSLGSFVFWVVDQELGNRVADFLDAHMAGLGMWIKANPVGAVVIAGMVFVAFCALIATRDEWIRKVAEFVREPDIPALEILWRPGEPTFLLEYSLPPDPAINKHFRVGVVNKSIRTRITDIEVKTCGFDTARVALRSLSPALDA